jgi:ribosome modulation factor
MNGSLNTPGFRAAYRKGYEAGKAGRSDRGCPYKAKRPTGRYTFAEVMLSRWMEGWRHGRAGIRSRLVAEGHQADSPVAQKVESADHQSPKR